MKTGVFWQIIEKNRAALQHYNNAKKLLVSNCICGGLLDDEEMADRNAIVFRDEDAEALFTLLGSDFIEHYRCPVAFELSKALELFRNSGLPVRDRAHSALMMSRINFMGTDGIRGKVVADSPTDCLSSFLQDGAFTPAIAEIASLSFASLLVDQRVCDMGSTVVLGNDGRDAAFDWLLSRAVMDGFSRAGLNVLDIGIVPTALVPFVMLKKDYHGGAMLTASHNPSNQNGIKFFLKGRKLLPEGLIGDYSLSAYMYYQCRCVPLPKKAGNVRQYAGAIDDGARLILSALPKNSSELLKDAVLVLDAANGAFSETGKRVLDSLGMPWTTKNDVPSGANINRGCGVAEIEGTDLFAGSAYGSHIPFVKELFDKGRANVGDRVFGISLDGDGDRGFLLLYDATADAVHVVDGDKCGYLLARYFLIKGKRNPADFWFVSTIESDLMTAASAEKRLGLRSRVVSVGDKWIGNFKEGKMLVGCEVSGHLIFPVKFMDESGKDAFLLSGIGLLTGLMTLVAIKEMGLGLHDIIEPYAPGFSKTWYAYFVDRTKFYRDSSVWQSDRDLVVATVDELQKSGRLPSDLRLEFEDKDDPNVLYVSLVNDQGLQGCVFMRNSGTEDKTATYVKGRPDLQGALVEIGRRVQDSHLHLLKNRIRVEYRYEIAIMRILESCFESDFGDLKIALGKGLGFEVNENELRGVVHGLRKEGRIAVRKVGEAMVLRKA